MATSLGEHLLTTVASVASIVGFTMAWWALRSIRDQMKLQSYLELTSRFEQILPRIPREVLECRRDVSMEECIADVDEGRVVRRSLTAYFALCAQEHVLVERGLLDRGIWKLWERRLEMVVSSPPARRVLEEMLRAGEFHSTEFRKRVVALVGRG